jgi:hypothetical protein
MESTFRIEKMIPSEIETWPHDQTGDNKSKKWKLNVYFSRHILAAFYAWWPYLWYEKGTMSIINNKCHRVQVIIISYIYFILFFVCVCVPISFLNV